MTHPNQNPLISEKSRYGRFGAILIAIGILLAIDTIADIFFFRKFWPLIIAMPGIGFIGIYLKRARQEPFYLGIGVYLLGFSVFALYCNFTSWQNTSMLWPLLIALLGVSFCATYLTGKHSPAVLLAGLVFISLSITFLLVFGVNGGLWWSIFLLLGSSFWIFDKVKRSK